MIDFGSIGVGDLAYNLTVAWTFFDDENRKIFKNYVELYDNTWVRALG